MTRLLVKRSALNSMSAAASLHELESRFCGPVDADESQEPETEAVTRLRSISPPLPGRAVIAIDLDDVLSQTNALIVECTSLAIEDTAMS
jgi:hypothetical protein